jgi:branched-chain amino acid transport system permease protein
VRTRVYIALAAGLLIAGVAATRVVGNEYYFFAGYVVLQYVVLATAWNILGGYTGYVNFGSAAFFAVGAYTTIAMIRFAELPLWLSIPAAGVVCGLIGLGAGYLTLRLRGVYFAIATLALAIVLETFVANWTFVGGATGAIVMRPKDVPLFDSFVELLFCVMLLLAVVAVSVARMVETSRVGRGLAAIRDDEPAAECSGVPTLRLKLLSATVSGALMGVAGAPYPYYVSFVDPPSAFNLEYAVNSVAMPMVGGTQTWIGPVLGALLLGSLQQVATVTISSELNLLIVGLVLVGFVILAPEGIVGQARRLWARRRR